MSALAGCGASRRRDRIPAGAAGGDRALHGAVVRDRDSDVRLLATELARNMKASEATRLLCELIEREQHPNVCAAAIDVLTEVGTPEAIPALEKCAARFAGNAVSAVRRLGRDRAHIGRGRLGEMRGSEGSESRSVHITPEEVQRFCEFLYRRTGMSFTEGKRYFIDRRLDDRIAATGSSSFQAYFSLLRADADHEIEHLINSFTVNETYFYREDHQLRCMTSSLLGGITSNKSPGSTIRIWSIPCSTGEEPYSIALWLMENWPEVDNYNIEIVGSDIDTRALKAAAEGIYGDRALMRLSRGIVSRYFTSRRGRQSSDRRGPSRLHRIHPRQPDRRAGYGAVPRFRPDLLPQRPDIF